MTKSLETTKKLIETVAGFEVIDLARTEFGGRYTVTIESEDDLLTICNYLTGNEHTIDLFDDVQQDTDRSAVIFTRETFGA